MLRSLSLSLLIVCVLSFGASVAGQTSPRLVPSQYSTISTALAASSTGDVVLVSPGIYYERIDFAGKAVTVQSTQGAQQTIIDAAQVDTTVVFESNEGPASLLDGFTIRGGRGQPNRAGGVHCRLSSPTIRNCIIEGNQGGDGAPSTILGGDGGTGGIMCVAAGATLDHCIIRNNTGGTGSIGLFSQSYNNGNGGVGGMTTFTLPVATIINCMIVDNVGGDGGAGPDISGSLFGGDGGTGGFDCDPVYGPDVVCTTIAGNTGGNGGNPASTSPGSWGMGGCGGYRGGNQFGPPSLPTLVNTIIWGNTGGAGSGLGPDDLQGAPVATYCNIGGGLIGIGNLDVNPLYRAPANGDYHLRSTSPLIDMGSGLVALLPALDIDGDPRIIGFKPEIGADEATWSNLFGSGEDFVMESFVNWQGDGTEFFKQASAGDLLGFKMWTPGGLFTAAPLLFGVNLVTSTSSLQPPAMYQPYLHLDIPSAVWLINGSQPGLLGGWVISTHAVVAQYLVPPFLIGNTARVQAICLSPIALNGSFATSDAHEITF